MPLAGSRRRTAGAVSRCGGGRLGAAPGVGARLPSMPGSTRGITHSLYAVQRSGDAIVDQFRQRDGTRPEVDTEHPDLRLDLVLRRERAILSLDLSGRAAAPARLAPGHGQAPLKENLAAAILLRARWPEVHAAGGSGRSLCGSATLLIEGAWMAADVAPGWLRERFGFHGWRGHDAALWQSLRDEAQARAKGRPGEIGGHFFGFDDNPTVLAEARRNAQQAGVAGFLHLGRRSLEHLKRPHEATGGDCSCAIRPTVSASVIRPRWCRCITLGERLTREFAGWRAAVIVRVPRSARPSTCARRNTPCSTGPWSASCTASIWRRAMVATARLGPAPAPDGAQPPGKELAAPAQARQREGVHALRVYDADLPEYAAAVDVYEARPAAGTCSAGCTCRIPGAGVDSRGRCRQRWRELLRAAGEALDVPRERIATKQRYRAKVARNTVGWTSGASSSKSRRRPALPGEPVGLPRHRALPRPSPAAGPRARAGARQAFPQPVLLHGCGECLCRRRGRPAPPVWTCPATDLDWASRNLALNGFAGAAHRLVRADAMAFAERDRGEYDLIFVDPPTFSNSKSAADFDVQRDHVRLLRLRATPCPGAAAVLQQLPPLPPRYRSPRRSERAGHQRFQHPLRFLRATHGSIRPGSCGQDRLDVAARWHRCRPGRTKRRFSQLAAASSLVSKEARR